MRLFSLYSLHLNLLLLIEDSFNGTFYSRKQTVWLGLKYVIITHRVLILGGKYHECLPNS